MKKAVTTVIGLLLIAGTVLVATFYFRQTRNFPEFLFPADTFFFAVIPDFRNWDQDLERTILWQKINTSPRKPSYQRQWDRLLSLMENGTGVDWKPLLDHIHRDVAMAVFPLSGDRPGAAITVSVRNESETRQFLEQKVDPQAKRRIPDLRKNNEEYSGVPYFRYSSHQFKKDVSPCYAFLEGRLILTTSDAAMKRLIDVKGGKEPALEKSESLRDVKRGLESGKHPLVYIDFQRMLSFVRTAVEGEKRGLWPALVRITGVDGLRSAGYTIRIKGDGFEERGFVSVAEEKQGLLKIYFDQPPQKLEAIEAIPPDVNNFSAGTMADFGLMWTEVNSQLGKVLEPSDYRKWQDLLNLGKVLMNFDVRRDLLDPLGSNYALTYQSQAPFSRKPGGTFLLILDLEKPDQLKSTLDKFFAFVSTRGMEKHVLQHRDAIIEHYPLEFGEFSADPSLCMDGSWLITATSPEWIKKAIDARRNKNGIRTTADYQKVTADFPEKMSGLSYVNIRSLFQLYATALRSEESAAWARETGLDQELDYLAESLYGSATYVLLDNDGLRMRSFASAPAVFLLLPAAATSLPDVLEKRR